MSLTSLLMTVGKDLTFKPFKPRHKYTWRVVGSDVAEHKKKGYRCVIERAEHGWEAWLLQIDAKEQKIVCRVMRNDFCLCRRELPLQPGILVLKRDEEHPRKSTASMRTLEFQAFLDRYGIDRVWHRNPNMTFENAMYRFGNGCATESVVTDGDLVIEAEETEDMGGELFRHEVGYKVSGASWMLETVCQPTGDKVRILHTLLRSTDRLGESFDCHGVEAE